MTSISSVPTVPLLQEAAAWYQTIATANHYAKPDTTPVTEPPRSMSWLCDYGHFKWDDTGHRSFLWQNGREIVHFGGPEWRTKRPDLGNLSDFLFVLFKYTVEELQQKRLQADEDTGKLLSHISKLDPQNKTAEFQSRAIEPPAIHKTRLSALSIVGSVPTFKSMRFQAIFEGTVNPPAPHYFDLGDLLNALIPQMAAPWVDALSVVEAQNAALRGRIAQLEAKPINRGAFKISTAASVEMLLTQLKNHTGLDPRIKGIVDDICGNLSQRLSTLSTASDHVNSLLTRQKALAQIRADIVEKLGDIWLKEKSIDSNKMDMLATISRVLQVDGEHPFADDVLVKAYEQAYGCVYFRLACASKGSLSLEANSLGPVFAALEGGVSYFNTTELRQLLTICMQKNRDYSSVMNKLYRQKESQEAYMGTLQQIIAGTTGATERVKELIEGERRSNRITAEDQKQLLSVLSST